MQRSGIELLSLSKRLDYYDGLWIVSSNVNVDLRITRFFLWSERWDPKRDPRGRLQAILSVTSADFGGSKTSGTGHHALITVVLCRGVLLRMLNNGDSNCGIKT